MEQVLGAKRSTAQAGCGATDEMRSHSLALERDASYGLLHSFTTAAAGMMADSRMERPTSTEAPSTMSRQPGRGTVD